MKFSSSKSIDSPFIWSFLFCVYVQIIYASGLEYIFFWCKQAVGFKIHQSSQCQKIKKILEPPKKNKIRGIKQLTILKNFQKIASDVF